jgi:hypothetical protein
MSKTRKTKTTSKQLITPVSPRHLYPLQDGTFGSDKVHTDSLVCMPDGEVVGESLDGSQHIVVGHWILEKETIKLKVKGKLKHAKKSNR